MKTGKLTGHVLFLTALLLATLSTAQAQQPRPLTMEQAEIAVDAAEDEARENGWGLVILVTDADGIPLYLRRMAGATARNYQIAMGKVHTALASGMHTHDYAAALEAGSIEPIPDHVTFEGGLLLRQNGVIIGAMSASGASGAEDAQAVRAGMRALGFNPD